MRTDPIIEEVRGARKQVEHDAAHAGMSLGAYLTELQKKHASRLVRRQPCRLQRRKTA